jgi:hypothetical protein
VRSRASYNGIERPTKTHGRFAIDLKGIPEHLTPVLKMISQSSSGKRALAMIVRLLIDSWVPSLLGEPPSLRDLKITALNDAPVVRQYQRDSRLAVGRPVPAGHRWRFATRTLYSNDKQCVIDAQRPVVLNGIEDFARAGVTWPTAASCCTVPRVGVRPPACLGLSSRR